MKILIVSTDDGNAGNGGAPIAKHLWEADEHEVTYWLDGEGSSARSWRKEEPWFRQAFGDKHNGAPIVMERKAEVISRGINWADRVVVTLSASGECSLEQLVTSKALQCGVPVIGIEEVPGGRHNPGWDKDNDYLARCLQRLVTVMPCDDDSEFPVMKGCCVGPLHFERYKDVILGEVGDVARRKLKLDKDEKVVWALLHPNVESPVALLDIGRAINNTDLEPRPTLVVTRHRRELTNIVHFNGAGYQYAMHYLNDHAGLKVIDNSPDFADVGGQYAIHKEMMPTSFPEFATGTEMLGLCYQTGVVVSGFASAALIDAPWLCVPSLLYIDSDGFTFGGLLQREKKITRLPLADLRQEQTVDKLRMRLDEVLGTESTRREHCLVLKERCPWPEQDPVCKAASLIVGSLN